MSAKGKSISQTHQALMVIKDKIKHYTETGNERKLAIYKSKLKQNSTLLLTMEALTKLKPSKVVKQ